MVCCLFFQGEGSLFLDEGYPHSSSSIAFIQADGRIIQIESMKPYSLDTHVSGKVKRPNMH